MTLLPEHWRRWTKLVSMCMVSGVGQKLKTNWPEIDRTNMRYVNLRSVRWSFGEMWHWPLTLRAMFVFLSVQCISSIGQIIKSVCVSMSESVSQWVSESVTQNDLNAHYRSQSSTDLHQTCLQGRVPGDVVTYCFWWKSEIFLSAKPEMELILTIAPMEKYL